LIDRKRRDRSDPIDRRPLEKSKTPKNETRAVSAKNQRCNSAV